MRQPANLAAAIGYDRATAALGATRLLLPPTLYLNCQCSASPARALPGRRVVPFVAYVPDDPQAARPGVMSSALKIPLRNWPV